MDPKRKRPTTFQLSVIALVLTFWLVLAGASKAAPTAIKGLGPQDALLVIDPSGQIVFSHNPDQPMVPASTLKVLTSLAALHYLGATHRFHTDFFLDRHNALGIKGYGDPLLVSEVISDITQRLAEKLPPQINGMLLDTSYFSGPMTIPGVSATTNPYDAPVGALCANFNTVFFTHSSGQLKSAEEQTPLLPMVLNRIRRSGLKEGRIILSHNHDEATLYAGNLFRHFLDQAGVAVRGAVQVTTNGLPEESLIYRHASPYDLAQIIKRLLEYSNNFTANQLLLAMGAQCYGPPATLDKGVRALAVYARNEIGILKGVFVEGSGISRHNRLSVRDMVAVLAHFSPHAHLLSHEGQEYFKTGTLRGIRTRAGYIEVKPGEFYRFALFRNRSGQNTGPVMRQIHRYLSEYQQ
jgi:D-alanyl-D-alanine carboxypeptidase/D-alanyl-D-alanine-endopeptidase (penicillin-binding protein 4)